MADIYKSLPFIFQHEGYKSNDVGDPGGLTIWGITKYAGTDGNGVLWVNRLNELSEEGSQKLAGEIYKMNYWDKFDLDEYKSEKLALVIFDSAVNCGPTITQHWIEELGNHLNTSDLIMKRIRYYASRCNQDPKMRAFLLGWLNRVINLWDYEIFDDYV